MKSESKKGKIYRLISSKRLNLLQISLLVAALIAVFIFVYSPHFSTPFPIHVDEWHYIEQTIKLSGGTLSFHSLNTFESGFDVFLFLAGKIVNLVFAYQFFAATWAILAALILFFVVYILSGKNFPISILSVIFFGSIKSNANILGLWFFTPLAFAIPFIFLYIFFFVRGLQIENKKYLLISLAIMIFLVFTHVISVLFALPILIFALLLYRKYVTKEYKFFLIFLLLPVVGFGLYSLVMNLPIGTAISHSLSSLQFSKAWDVGVTATPPSGPSISARYAYVHFMDIYSIIGLALAFIGFFIIVLRKKKDFYPYAFWSVYLAFSMFWFYMTGYSYLAPSYRIWYYFAISLPVLSAFGMVFIVDLTRKLLGNIKLGKKKDLVEKLIIIVLIGIILFFSFHLYSMSYISKHTGEPSYFVTVTPEDYSDLVYLSALPKSSVLAPFQMASAVYPVSGQNSIGSFFDYPKAFWDENYFYSNSNCTQKDNIIRKYNVSYVISSSNINCNYPLLRSKYNFVYNVSGLWQ